MITGPDIPKGVSVDSVSVSLSDVGFHWTLTMRTDDEGGGAFLRLTLDGEMEMDPGEIEKLGRLGSALCAWQDAISARVEISREAAA
jgi:hypothetical protein